MVNDKKRLEVELLTEKIKTSKAVVMMDYKGIDCLKLNKIRKLVGLKGDLEYIVVKNRLFKIALKNANINDNFDDILKGTTSFIISYDDPMKATKLSKDFRNESEFLKVKGGIIENKAVDKALIEKLSNIPSKNVLISQLLGALSTPLARLSNVLKHLSENKN